jgi:hypothetical protein
MHTIVICDSQQYFNLKKIEVLQYYESLTICEHLLVRILNNHAQHVILCIKVRVFKILICRAGGLQPRPVYTPCLFAIVCNLIAFICNFWNNAELKKGPHQKSFCWHKTIRIKTTTEPCRNSSSNISYSSILCFFYKCLKFQNQDY